MKNKGISTLIGILIIVVFALIAGGVLYWYSKEKVKMPEVKTPEVKTLEEIKTPETKKPEEITDETADWKTYRNEEYGFEMRYPLEWDIPDSIIKPVGALGEIYSVGWYAQSTYLKEILGLESPPLTSFQIGITIWPKGKWSSEEWVSSGIGNPYSPHRGETVKLKQINIGGIPGQILTSKENVYEILSGSIYVPKNGVVYNFDIGIYVDEKIIEKVLSTFRFLE